MKKHILYCTDESKACNEDGDSVLPTDQTKVWPSTWLQWKSKLEEKVADHLTQFATGYEMQEPPPAHFETAVENVAAEVVDFKNSKRAYESLVRHFKKPVEPAASTKCKPAGSV